MGEGDENTAKDASQFIKNCDLMRDLTGAHVMFVHHSGKDGEKSGCGPSAYRAGVDSEILVNKQTIKCTKYRDGCRTDDEHFTPSTVNLGSDQDSDPITSAVFHAAEGPPKRQSRQTEESRSQ